MKDNSNRYGSVSRFLHWGMALLLLWQFISAASHLLAEDTPIEAFLWPTHKPLGLLLFILIFIRLVWALTSRFNRPPSISIAAKLGHIALYGFLIAVPVLALIRQYGSGKAFAPFGLPLFPGFKGDRINWMVELGNLFHGWLGWILLIMVIGHIFMVFWHRRSATHANVLPRMWR